MMNAEDTLLRYWRIGRLCVEVHSDFWWGFLEKEWRAIDRTLNIGPLCLYWHPGR